MALAFRNMSTFTTNGMCFMPSFTLFVFGHWATGLPWAIHMKLILVGLSWQIHSPKHGTGMDSFFTASGLAS